MGLLHHQNFLSAEKIRRGVWVFGLTLLSLWIVACQSIPANEAGTGARASSVQLPADGRTNSVQTSPAAKAIATSETFVSEGTTVVFSVKPVSSESDLTEFNFALTDSATGKPIGPAARPAVWVDLQKAVNGTDQTKSLTCQDKVRLYAQGTIGFRPEIDLNSYFVLALNNDASISVIDPLTGVTGISQLFAMIVLKSRGEDWTLSQDGTKLFVTMPEAGQVAVVDTASFKVLMNLDVGSNPVHLVAQPDGKYLWVSNDSSDGAKSGVTIIDVAGLTVVSQIRTGVGAHEIAFSGQVVDAHPHDNEKANPGTTSYAFVTNKQAGSLSIIDIERLKKVEDLGIGKQPGAIDFSSVANAVYVASEADGTIAVVDVAKHKLIQRINAAQGIKSLRFAPGGRWGFAVSPKNNRVDVIDATTNRILQSVTVNGEPDKVSFTETYAYVHATRTAEVSLIDLNRIDQPGTLPVVQIIGGQTAPVESPFQSVADVIVPVHEHGNHVLIANPADQYIYYYMEGMKSPMGGFQNYSRAPRAVRVVDRAIRETGQGTYSTQVQISKSGEYQATFLLDSPRIVHCFSFTMEPTLAMLNQDDGKSLTLQFLSTEREFKVGQALNFKFALTDTRKNMPASGIDDVYVVATLASGLRNDRYRAVSIGEGQYEVALTLPMPGIYNVYFTIPSRKISFDDLPRLTLRGTADANAK